VRQVVPVGDASIEVFAAGGGGRTVCTAHPTDSMEAALPLLANAAGARAVCVNPRGVGGSSTPASAEEETLERMADDVDAVRLALGIDRWVLWGMSGGSMIAQVYAYRHPAALESLILDSAGACFAETLRDPDCMMNPASLAPVDPAPDTADDAWTWTAAPGAGWALRRGAGPVLLVAPSEPSDSMRRIMPALLAFDARPWLDEIRVPTLVLGGAEDRVAPPAQLRALHEAIAGSTLALIEGAGHVPASERPEDVTAAVRRFLDERS
jgi:3-oxoadipate enol-lactonase